MKQIARACASAALIAALAGCAASTGTALGRDPIPAVRVPAGGSVAPSIVLDAASKGATVSADVYGASVVTWYQFWQPFVRPSLRELGIHLVRFPGGSESDAYHWEHGGSLCASQGYIYPGASFDKLMSALAVPLKLDVAITLNYGSNPACDGGGDPSEAGAWVAHAKQRGYRVAYWTVGNEDYGSWEYDLHATPHDPHTYADAVRTGYYPAVKNADASAKLGIVVDDPSDAAWNDVVLRKAQPFDFVELHEYPEYDTDSDSALLHSAISNFARELTRLRSQMTAAGVSKLVPIYVGEFNNDAGEEGKQSVSIVNGLYLGQMLGTMIAAGVPMATWWLSYGSCDQDGDFDSSLYGWQNFGSEALFSDGLPDPYEYCSGTPTIPGGTPFPTARVMALYARSVPAGSTVRTVTLAASLAGRVRAYGYAVGKGYALVLFNDTLDAIAVRARVRNAGNAFTATLATYGKTQYDRSRNNRWVGPVTRKLGGVSSNVTLALPAYSISVLSLK